MDEGEAAEDYWYVDDGSHPEFMAAYRKWRLEQLAKFQEFMSGGPWWDANSTAAEQKE
jgi:hypothetical protein